jgi:hypothetical protein
MSNTPVKTPEQKKQEALDVAYKAYQEGTKQPTGGWQDRLGKQPTHTISDYDAAVNAYKAAGLDPSAIPKNIDLGMYNTLAHEYKVDPSKIDSTLRESTYYDDGRTKNEANTRDLLAKGLNEGKASEDMWKDVHAYNDAHQNGDIFKQLSDGVSHAGKVVSENKMAQTVISMAAAAYGIPPNVTMALLAGNNIAQGQDPMEVAKGIAMSYIGGKVGDFAGGAAKDALSGSGLGDNITGALTNVASGAAKQLATTGNINAQGLLTNAAGNIIQGSDTVKDLTGGISDNVSAWAKDHGLDKIDVGGFKIPGGDGGQIIPGLDRNGLPVRIVETVLKGTPGYRQAATVVNKVANPIQTAINAAKNPGGAVSKAVVDDGTKAVDKLINGNQQQDPAVVAEKTPEKQADGGYDLNSLLAILNGGGGTAAQPAAPEYKTADVGNVDLSFLDRGQPDDGSKSAYELMMGRG